MRYETIKVKKSAWVRIVNPNPIRILGMTWSYGSYVRIEPGGTFHALFGLGPRVLAMYQPPNAPSDSTDAPPDALVLYTPDELRMLAEGLLSFNEPFGKAVPRRAKDEPAATARVGDKAEVPFSRMVKAVPPHAMIESASGGPYREEVRIERLNCLTEDHPIRPGGTMTVFTFCGERPRALLKVMYRANPTYRGEQCPSGHWFYIPEDEFLIMRDAAKVLRGAEALERSLVIHLLNSL